MVCILIYSFINHPDDGQRSDRKVLVTIHSILLNIFINVHLYIDRIIIKNSSMPAYGANTK